MAFLEFNYPSKELGRSVTVNVLLPTVEKLVSNGGNTKEYKTLYLLHGLLDELGIEHVYKESEGDHSWKW